MSFLWSLGSFIVAIAVLVAVHDTAIFGQQESAVLKFIVFRLALVK